MRDMFETIPLDDPIKAARRGGRPALRRRFYAKATIASGAAGQVVCLDGKPIHTPARRVLAAPTATLATAIAAEWEAQRDLIDPAKMPLTQLANAVIDGVAEAPGPVAGDIEKYLASDLLFYRASGPQDLRERQARQWDPVVAWAHDELGAHFRVGGEGIVFVGQPKDALKAAATAIPGDPWRLGAVHVVTTLTGSALIALALLHHQLSAEAAWQAAHVDEDWNMEQWGSDEMALERRSFHFTELQAAATVLGSLPG
jgi:chaperone required for assembly of F1-ATPase